MYLGEFLFESPEHVKIPWKGQVGVKSRYDMELPHAFFSAPRLFENILDTHLVSAGLALAPAECAELASVHTDVRGINVHVLDEVDLVLVFFLSNMGSHATEQEKIIRFEEVNTIFTGEALFGKNFIFDTIDRHGSLSEMITST
jgi:hypothetical protein